MKFKKNLVTLPAREPDPGLTLVFNLDQQRFAKMGEVVAIQNTMTEERFNELLEGPLSHPMPLLMLNRLALALHHVVEATGEAGARALEEYCKEREENSP